MVMTTFAMTVIDVMAMFRIIMVLRVVLFLVLITHHLVQVRVVDSGLIRLLWTLVPHLTNLERQNVFTIDILLLLNYNNRNVLPFI